MRLTFNACTNTDVITPALSRAVARQLASWLGDTVTVGPVLHDEAIFTVENSHLKQIVAGTPFGDEMLSALDFDFLSAGVEAGVLFVHVEIRVDDVLLWDSATERARAVA